MKTELTYTRALSRKGSGSDNSIEEGINILENRWFEEFRNIGLVEDGFMI